MPTELSHPQGTRGIDGSEGVRQFCHRCDPSDNVSRTGGGPDNSLRRHVELGPVPV